MAGQAHSLATRGVICKGGEINITKIFRCVLPVNLKLTRNIFNINLKLQDIFKLNSIIDKTKINLLKQDSKLNIKLPKLKVNLKKCEE